MDDLEDRFWQQYRAMAKDRDFVMSFMVPIIATLRAGLQSGAISVEAAISNVPEGTDEAGDHREMENARQMIRSWSE